MRPWIRWAICWLCTSRRPMSRIAPKSANWPGKCSRSREENVELAYVDQGYTGEAAEEAAAEHGIQLEVVKHTEAKRGFVLLPRRWVVERSFAWAARFRRLARDYERLATTLGAFHFLAFACLMIAQPLQAARMKLITGSRHNGPCGPDENGWA